MDAKKSLQTALKAFVIGSTMTVPGVSGGSMAMILGEYNALIGAIPGLLKRDCFFKSLTYLMIFLIAGLSGVLIISKPLSILLESHYIIIMYFFLGTVSATIPSIIREAGMTGRKCKLSEYVSAILYTAAGCIIVFSIQYIPDGVFSLSMDLSIKALLQQIIGGFLLSIGFVLPGISISYLLVVTGLYGTVLNLISSLDILPLIPIGVGGVAGVFTLAGFLSWAMEKHKRTTYMIILGFLLGSVVSVFPALPKNIEILWCIISFTAGFVTIWVLSKTEKTRYSKS